jgi:aerobic carbon-monoxide dehydrogenase medium subunit
MKSAAFDYFVAKNVDEAAAALAGEGDAVAIAGGQSLVPMLNLRVALPDLLVDIAGLEELKETYLTPSRFRVGALTTHADFEDGTVPDPFSGLMRKVASGISYRAVRNYGTIGGSVALADPAADWPVCLMALAADVRIATRNGVRSQAINDFIKGEYVTSLARDEIILGFDIQRSSARMRWGAFKVARKTGAFAISIATVVEHAARGPVLVALGAAGPRPYLLPTIAKCISAGVTSEVQLRDAIEKDLTLCIPHTDSYQTRLHTSTILRAAREMLSR